MPWSSVERLDAVPSGLYRTSWAPAADAGRLEVLDVGAVTWFDCGTPRTYLAANLWASGGETVVGDGASVDGTAVRTVLWPGTAVAGRERLVDAIRASERVTVLVR